MAAATRTGDDAIRTGKRYGIASKAKLKAMLVTIINFLNSSTRPWTSRKKALAKRGGTANDKLGKSR
jgi:hypothetical protein